MKIIIDGDGCPVKDITINLAKHYNTEVTIFFDTAHVYQSDYAKVIYVEKGFDSVDFALLKVSSKGDIVVTQDYGLASMCLSKGCVVINQNGLIYTDTNINSLLNQRYMSKKARDAKIRVKGPKKRSSELDEKFKYTLNKILNDKTKKNDL